MFLAWPCRFVGRLLVHKLLMGLFMISKMTPEHFRQIREAADLSRSQLATILRIKEVKTIYRYEHGEREISGPVSLLMEMIEDGRL